MAKGFNQRLDLDFHDTFSPVTKMTTIRLVLSLALHFSWKIQQLDVKNAFPHGFIAEDIYMEQPSGYIDPNYPNHVCHLRKAIYSLRQAPRVW